MRKSPWKQETAEMDLHELPKNAPDANDKPTLLLNISGKQQNCLEEGCPTLAQLSNALRDLDSSSCPAPTLGSLFVPHGPSSWA